jgi:acyl carrier protein
VTAPAWSKAEVYERLREVLIGEFGLRAEQLGPDADLVKDLDLDSIDWIDMAVALEVRTGRGLRETELAAIRTIQDVVDVIHRKLQEDARE